MNHKNFICGKCNSSLNIKNFIKLTNSTVYYCHCKNYRASIVYRNDKLSMYITYVYCNNDLYKTCYLFDNKSLMIDKAIMYYDECGDVIGQSNELFDYQYIDLDINTISEDYFKKLIINIINSKILK